METKDMICIVCPAGCHIRVKGENGKITEITGYTCPRGKEYATGEFLMPKRNLTSTVKAEGYTCPVIPVRSKEPIPRDKLFEAMDEIRRVQAKPPFYVGKIVIKNVAGTGVDIIMSNR